MTYINNKLFSDAKAILNEKNYSWFLIGNPTSHVVDEDLSISPESYLINNGKFLFRDYNIAGFSNFLSSDNMKTSYDEADINSFKYNLSGTNANTNGQSSVRFTITAGAETTNDYGFNEKLMLCLCSMKIDNFDDLLNRIIVTESNKDNPEKPLFFNSGSSQDISTKYIPAEGKEHMQIINDYISDVIVAYTVEAGMSINSYNYSGFVVGDTTINISGLLTA